LIISAGQLSSSLGCHAPGESWWDIHPKDEG
jgi:hypothetical protein